MHIADAYRLSIKMYSNFRLLLRRGDSIEGNVRIKSWNRLTYCNLISEFDGCGPPFIRLPNSTEIQQTRRRKDLQRSFNHFLNVSINYTDLDTRQKRERKTRKWFFFRALLWPVLVVKKKTLIGVSMTKTSFIFNSDSTEIWIIFSLFTQFSFSRWQHFERLGIQCEDASPFEFVRLLTSAYDAFATIEFNYETGWWPIN